MSYSPTISDQLTSAFRALSKPGDDRPAPRSAGYISQVKKEIAELEDQLRDLRKRLVKAEDSEVRLIDQRLRVQIFPYSICKDPTREQLIDGLRELRIEVEDKAPSCSDCRHASIAAHEQYKAVSDESSFILEAGCAVGRCVKKAEVHETQIRAAASDQKSQTLIGPQPPERDPDLPETDSPDSW